MLKNHPKGLIWAALSNMGERFGFYTMMALLSLFLVSKFGLEKTQSTLIYSVFYALTYLLALGGGMIADKTKKYKQTILIGLILMAVGYVLIAIPTPTPVPNLALFLTITCLGLFVISLGNGLFKGNLQAMIGQMYDDPKYSKNRDSGFQIFYMFINIGAMIAPILAVLIRNWWVAHNGYVYNSDLPVLCHDLLKGKTFPGEESYSRLEALAKEVSGGTMPSNLTDFANSFLSIFNTGFHYAFSVAVFATLISLAIYIKNKRKFPDPAMKKATVQENSIVLSPSEIKQRIYALIGVFGVVIFFWFSFHQNGVTLTFFANDYTNLDILKFKIGDLLELKGAELFQAFNPIFVVILTPIVIAFFGWLRAKGKEPSTPKKIAIGMGIAALAFIVMLIGSVGLPSNQAREAMGGLDNSMRVMPWLLIGTYFILTIAELFISPLGISFVSKVAPPHLQGVMQGCWFGATAAGNQLLIVGTILYEHIPIWATWLVFVIACSISMFTMIFMLKWLERVSK